MPHSLSRLLPLVLATWVTGPALAQQPGQPPAWSVLDLGSLGGGPASFSSLNNRGQVVGTAETADGLRAFIHDAGRMTAIAPPAGLRNSEGVGLNDLGQVVGFAWDNTTQFTSRAFSWSGGQLTPLAPPGAGDTRAVGVNQRGDVLLQASVPFGPSSGHVYSNGSFTDIGTLGGPSTMPRLINNNGQVAGTSTLFGGQSQGFIYSGGSMQPLATEGSAVPAALNDAGQVAGSHLDLPAIFHDGQITSLGNLGGRSGTLDDINNAGQAIGTINFSPPTDRIPTLHAFLYSDGQVQDLNASFVWEGLPSISSTALDINENGQLVVRATFRDPLSSELHSRFFLWDDGRVTDIDAVLAEEGVSSLAAVGTAALNDLGQIAINGSNGVLATPYLVTPIPEPSTYALMLAGLCAIAFAARRQRRRGQATAPIQEP